MRAAGDSAAGSALARRNHHTSIFAARSAFSVFTCVVLARQLRAVGAPAWLRAVNVAWAVGIVYSTMAVRQHVLIDVLGGLALGVAFGLATRERAAAAAPA